MIWLHNIIDLFHIDLLITISYLLIYLLCLYFPLLYNANNITSQDLVMFSLHIGDIHKTHVFDAPMPSLDLMISLLTVHIDILCFIGVMYNDAYR